MVRGLWFPRTAYNHLRVCPQRSYSLMSCTRYKRELPCPHHPDEPLTFPEFANAKTVVVNLYVYWISQQWFSTVTVDAVRVFESESKATQAEALQLALNFLSEPR